MKHECAIFPVQQIISTSIAAMCTALLMVEMIWRIRACFFKERSFFADAIWCCTNSITISTTSISQRRLFCLSKWTWRSYVHMFQWTWTGTLVQSIDSRTVQWYDRCSLESKFILLGIVHLSSIESVDNSQWRYSIVMVRSTTNLGHVLTKYCYLFHYLWTIEMFHGLSTNECQSMDTGHCRRSSENMCSDCYESIGINSNEENVLAIILFRTLDGIKRIDWIRWIT